MLSNLFDEYSINARVRPALLALLPAIVFVYVMFPQLYALVAGLISALVICGFVTALAHYTRSRGRGIEVRLISSWGGKPTTILLRHRDSSIDPITKRRYRAFLEKCVDGWKSPSEEEEKADANSADHAYDSAVKWLLEHTRDQKKYQMIFKENISYGFRRNCLGIRWIAVVVALCPIATLASVLEFGSESLVAFDLQNLVLTSLFSFGLLCWWLFLVGDEWVRDAANSYASRLLAACEGGVRA